MSAKRSSRVAVWMFGALAACGIAAVLLPRASEPSLMQAQLASAGLLSSWTTHGRPIEPRLSGGFPWAPYRRPAASKAATRSVMRGDDDAESSHASGVAQLLNGNVSQALSLLESNAGVSNDAALWNDLAVTRYESAVHYDRPELIADALAAVDHALAIRGDLAEALFNRALVIERLGFRDDAHAAWARYLEVDSTSGWADEARTHLAAVAPEEAFMTFLDRQYDLVGSDPAAAAAVVEHDPFGARGLTIKEVLGRWGRAVLRGDEQDATRHLRVARQLVAAVTHNGDHMLERAVAAIEASAGEDRLLLANAHATYRDGLEAYGQVKPVEAEPLLLRAASMFERARDPMMYPAAFFATNTIYDQGRREEAEERLKRLRASMPAEFPAYRAFVLWQLGMCYAARADWGQAMVLYEESRELFASIHESGNEAMLRQLLAIVYEHTGDPEAAWRERVAARGKLGARAEMVREKTLASIADAAMLREAWETAASFLTLHVHALQHDGDEAGLANTLFLRAVVRDRLHDGAGARDDFIAASAAAARSSDPSYRASLRIAERRARAMLGDTAAAEADRLLTEAIAFQETQSDPANVPGLLLQRARARRDAGDADGAMADVQRGVSQLERARESLPEGEARWGAFHGAEGLFDLGVELALDKRDPVTAFQFAERARARALLDSYGGSPLFDPRRMPPHTLAVEYVALPSRLIVFTADASGVRATTVDVRRDVLSAFGSELAQALRHGDELRARMLSTELYEHLIAPIETQVRAASLLAVVADPTTASVPFSALRDRRGAFLIADRAIVNAPSAAVFVAASEKRMSARAHPRSILIVTGEGEFEGNGSLMYVNDEVRAISTLYPSAVNFAGDAQLGGLRTSGADVIHFAGHAVGDERGLATASIVVRVEGRERRIDVSEIARWRLAAPATVVLAGCSTGQGQRRAAEGVVSVAHAFLAANAGAVIATQWPIDDAIAAKFYPRLHRRLAQGLSPAEALRAAQLESIERDDVPASLWAAVEDIGS